MNFDDFITFHIISLSANIYFRFEL